MEDLEGFNGAGLNESVKNVEFHRSEIANAIKQVWKSAFQERSVFWRAMAFHSHEIPVAVPSVIVQMAVPAKSSGVIVSRGGKSWKIGEGLINADYGIGQVVDARQPVEEITLENGQFLRYGLTVSNQRPEIGDNGSIVLNTIEPGQRVLDDEEVLRLNHFAITIDEFLGEQEFGWDIEYAFDFEGRLWIVQARPN